jgi:uncharacterized protein (TIGR01589 family)
MSPKEVITTLLEQAKIEPSFTELVWLKLEEENQDFFKAYRLRMIVKEQIAKFNSLLEKQCELTLLSQSSLPSISSIMNGTNIQPMHEFQALYSPEAPDVPRYMPDRSMSGADMAIHGQRIGVSPNILMSAAHQGMSNGGIIKAEASGYGGGDGSAFLYGGGGLEMRAPATVSSLRNVDANLQAVNEALVDNDSATFGYLHQIPRNFSLSDLTADFTNSSEILENYSRSPFLTDNFMDPRTPVPHQGDANRLGSISEGLSQEDFGSSD